MAEILQRQIEQNADADLGEHRHRRNERLAQEVTRLTIAQEIAQTVTETSKVPSVNVSHRIKRMPGQGSFC